MTPKMLALWTWEFARTVPNPVKKDPPVPTTNCRMPFASTLPEGFCEANRSYEWACPDRSRSTRSAYIRSTSGAMSADAKELELHRGRWSKTIVHAAEFVPRSALSQSYWGDPTAQPAPPFSREHSELMFTRCQAPMSKE